jgi:hypothetical protein
VGNYKIPLSDILLYFKKNSVQLFFLWFYKLGKGQTVKLSCVIKDAEARLLHSSPQKHLPHVAWDNELKYLFSSIAYNLLGSI